LLSTILVILLLKKGYYRNRDTAIEDNQANTKTEQSELKLPERIGTFSESAPIGSGLQVLFLMGIKSKNSTRAEAEPRIMRHTEF